MEPLEGRCQHSHEAETSCLNCGKSVCDKCGISLKPESNDQRLCLDCAVQLASQQEQHESLASGPANGIFNFEKAPFTTGFCLLLAVIYLVSAFPVWTQAQPGFLDFTSLDITLIKDQHQYWRLLTANLVHANLTHIGMNAFALLIFGHLLEVQIGGRMLLLWGLAAMLGCDLASIAMNVPNSVGVSGIAYGLQTAFVILTGKVLIAHRLQDVKTTLRSLIGYLIVIVALNFMSPQYINIYGHMGGAAAGLLCALAYPVTRPPLKRDFALLVLLIIALISLVPWVLSSCQLVSIHGPL